MYYARYGHKEADGVHKLVRWAKTVFYKLFYKLFPEQKQGREKAMEYERQTKEDDRVLNHFLFRRIKDMDDHNIEKLRRTQMGPIIERMAKQEEERRSANH